MKIIMPLLLMTGISHAKELRTKIAVIDTGVSKSQATKSYMCDNGVKNMTIYENSDFNGHGSHIAHIIGSRINAKKFCIVSYKVYHNRTTIDVLYNTLKALKDIAKNSYKYVNISMSGGYSALEFDYLEKLTKNGVKVSVAAGNDGKDLDKVCDVFPACYKKFMNDNYYVVSARDLKKSNKGKFTIKEKGKDVMSYGGVMSGSSQATAIWTSKLINRFK